MHFNLDCEIAKIERNVTSKSVIRIELKVGIGTYIFSVESKFINNIECLRYQLVTALSKP